MWSAREYDTNLQRFEGFLFGFLFGFPAFVSFRIAPDDNVDGIPLRSQILELLLPCFVTSFPPTAHVEEGGSVRGRGEEVVEIDRTVRIDDVDEGGGWEGGEVGEEIDEGAEIEEDEGANLFCNNHQYRSLLEYFTRFDALSTSS